MRTSIAGAAPRATVAGPSRVSLMALALAAGITIGWHQPRPVILPWLAFLVVAVLAAMVLSYRLPHRRSLFIGVMAVACAAFGAAWVTVRYHHVAANDLAALIDEEPRLVCVRGIALEAPELRERRTGSLSRFDYRSPTVTYFTMQVKAIVRGDGDVVPVRGKVLVRVDEAVEPFRAGDRLEVQGWMRAPGAPRNPGEFDYRQAARSHGRAGLLMVPRRELLAVTPTQRRSVGRALVSWRRAVQRRASAWLLADLSEPGGRGSSQRDGGRSPRDALLLALLLGQRERELDDLTESFRRVGLAHLLAISGLHLGVLAGFVLAVARLGGHYRRWQGWLVIGVVLGYLVLVDVRMPVLRAGVMTIAASLGLALGRRLRISGLVGLSAIGLLLWRPDQLFTAGFQLSYGVVLGLIWLAPAVRRRWFGPPDLAVGSSSAMLGQWVQSAFAVAVTAWLVATPVIMYHFGMVSPLAAPLSVVALPLVAVLLGVGYLKILLALLLPSAALLLAVPLSICADVLVSVVGAMDALPFSVVRVPYPPALWSVLAVAWVAAWALHDRGRRAQCRLVWGGGFALVGWPVVAMVAGASPALRIDMLAVGDGSCYLLRSGGTAVVFDAGSSDLDAGRRSIVPTLRRFGVGEIDAVVVSHPNLDHYSAVLELVDEFRAETVLVTQRFLEEAQRDHTAPAAALLDELAVRLVSVERVAAGEVRRFGDATWTWLAPLGTRYERPNDSSMVIRVEAADRRVLLCGDIQHQAIEALQAGGAELGADILELPHHGSYSAAAAGFVDRVNPEIVMQSSGPTRWRQTKGRWAVTLGKTEWLSTARDGACWVEIEKNGDMQVGRFID